MCNIRVYSDASFWQWLIKDLDQYISRWKELWFSSLSLTDKNLFNSYKFIKWCNEKGIKPMLWVELNVLLDEKDGEKTTLVFYAKNKIWFRELNELVTQANVEKWFDNYYLNFEDIKKYSSNLKVLVPYESWFITKYFYLKKRNLVNPTINKLKDLLWDNLYFEYQFNKKWLEIDFGKKIIDDDYKKINKTLLKLKKELWLKLIPSSYSLFLKKENDKIYDIYYWMTHKLLESDKNKIDFKWSSNYILSKDEFKNELKKVNNFVIEEYSKEWYNDDEIKSFSLDLKDFNDFYSWFESFEIPKISNLPKLSIPNDVRILLNEFKEKYKKEMHDEEFHIRYSSLQWFKKFFNKELTKEQEFILINKEKISFDKLENKTIDEIKELVSNISNNERKDLINSFSKKEKDRMNQLDYELFVMHTMWFDAYMLMVADYIWWARKNWIPVWPWRWSAMWSVLAYYLWITNWWDPIDQWLIFERFQNPSRISMPDIDTDFDWVSRDHLIDYVRNKYWKDNVAEVSTFWTYAAKAVIKDVAKYYWKTFQEVNNFVKKLPPKAWITIQWMLDQSEFFRNACANDSLLKEIVEVSKEIEWTKRNASVHACAVIISPENLKNITWLQYSKNGKIVTQLEAHDLEELWLLKMDFLWLNNLTILKEIGKKIDFNISIVNKNKEKLNNYLSYFNEKLDIIEKLWDIVTLWRKTNDINEKQQLKIKFFEIENSSKIINKDDIKFIKPNINSKNLKRIYERIIKNLKSELNKWEKYLNFITNNLNRDFLWTIDFNEISYKEKEVFENIFSKGDTTWVFQFESPWMRKYLKDLKPDTFEDLVAMVSLYRPWPIAYIPTYIKTKHWDKWLRYMTNDLVEILKDGWYSNDEIEWEKKKLEKHLWPILDKTYWISVYQEQLMFIVQKMWWFSLSEADLLRRWIWKKKIEIIEKLKKDFIVKSWESNWYKPETAKYIYEEMIEPAWNYSFNKSHALAYARIAYQTWFARNFFPIESYEILLNSKFGFKDDFNKEDKEDKEDIDTIDDNIVFEGESWDKEKKEKIQEVIPRIIKEMLSNEDLNLKVNKPNINKSDKFFKSNFKWEFEYWLLWVSWLWEDVIKLIIDERDKNGKFNSFNDFLNRVDEKALNKKSLNGLIMSWAMDDLWDRNLMLELIPQIIEDKKIDKNQISIFSNWNTWKFNYDLEITSNKTSSLEKILMEYHTLWYMFEENPILKDQFKDYFRRNKLLKEDIEKIISRNKTIKDINEKEPITILWFIENKYKQITRDWQEQTIYECISNDFKYSIKYTNNILDKYHFEIWDYISFKAKTDFLEFNDNLLKLYNVENIKNLKLDENKILLYDYVKEKNKFKNKF